MLFLRVRVNIELAHEGHQGIVKTKDRLRSTVWWPHMNSMVESHCKKCLGCKAVTPAATMPPVKTTTMQTKQWRGFAVDLMGPHPIGLKLKTKHNQKKQVTDPSYLGTV